MSDNLKRNMGALVAIIVVLLLGIALPALADIPTDPGPPGDFVSKTYGGTYNDAIAIAVPTANATADAGLTIHNDSVADSILVENASATPVFKVGKTGAVTGLVLKYASTNKQQICGTSTVTDVLAITSGLSAIDYAVCNVKTASPAGDAVRCFPFWQTYAGVLTATVRNSAVTPAANSAGVTVVWCAVGAP
jgi:hypothetical protein